MKTSLQYEIVKLFDVVEDKETGKEFIDFKKNYAFPIDANFKRITKYINDLIDMENTRAGRSPMVYNWLENFDTTYSAEFTFYMLTGTEAINSAKLKIVGQNYRGYSGSITSGGSGSTGTPSNNTSGGQSVSHTHDCPSTGAGSSHSHSNPSVNSGGSHTHTLSGSTTATSESKGADVDGTSGEASGHTHHSGTYACVSHTHTYYRRSTADSGGSHQHTQGSTGSESSHSHPVGNTGNANQSHTHSLSSHTHGVGDHTHGLSLSIKEGNNPTGVNVYVDDGSGYGGSIATDNSPVDIEIDIKSHLTTTIGWKKIRVTSTREGRISVTLVLDVNLLAL